MPSGVYERTPEHLVHLSRGRTPGFQNSVSTRAKISAANKGNKYAAGNHNRTGQFITSRLRPLTEIEASWLGAMVDAEGSVVRRPNGRYRFMFVNTEVEYISAFLRLTGVGSISVKTSEGRLLCYSWEMGAENEVKAFAQAISLYSLKARKVLCATS
jgi:hypothetical protein